MKKLMKCLLALVLLFLTACSSGGASGSKTITSTYTPESLDVDMSHYEWIVGKVAQYRETSLMEASKTIENGGSGLFYFGYDTCDWCGRALPELNKVLNDYDFVTYYVNVHSENYSPTEEDIQHFMKLIDSELDHDANGEAIFYVPLVLGIKNGKVTGSHTSLVDSYVAVDIKDPNDQMSDASKLELQQIYRDIINKTVD